jgi:hypothetical protein
MKSTLLTKNSSRYLFAIAAIFLFACSDDDIEPVGMNNDDPVGEDPMEEPMISDNPVVRINSGGLEVGFGDTVFTEDNFFIGDSQSFTNTSITDIEATEMDDIYFSERNSFQSQGAFGYSIPITNGTYRVNLHFAEIFWGAPDGEEGNPDARVFDVDIEGESYLNNYDIFEEVGAVTAVIKSFVITVEDEELNIMFEASVDRPKLSALEVLGDGMVITPEGN